MRGGARAMTEDASEEAAWRDLVAHYATSAAADGVEAPWPTREDLPGPGAQGQDVAGQDSSGPDTADLDITGLDMTGPEGTELDETPRPGPRRTTGPAPFGGMATLVVRMGDRPPRDSGPDDGAVV